MKEFITPIIKDRKREECTTFFTMGEYEEWCKKVKDFSKYDIKYYKGLGTSTSKEAKEYFKNINIHKILFRYNGKPDDESIDLAFSKNLANKRKEWLENVNRNEYIDHSI